MNNNQHKFLEKFYNSKGFNEWSIKNPIATKELVNPLSDFISKHIQTPGFIKTLKNLSSNSNEMWGEWWNYYSEIRCADYLEKRIVKIDEFNHKLTNSDVDFRLSNGQRWDVVSFGGSGKDIKHESISDIKTIFNLYKKIEPKFTKQKADYVVCDDIFSATSNNYPLTWYFFEQAYTTRRDEFKSIFGQLIDKILVLSFNREMFNYPSIVFKGKDIHLK